MKLGSRIIATLAASIVLSSTLLLLERATESKALFLLQLPGFLACVLIWGVHLGPEDPAVSTTIVFGAANATVYWPILFGLSFLFIRGSKAARDNLP